jgi:hypothetical protein
MTKKHTLDRVYLRKPCSTEWGLMEGNEQVRLCNECNKQVYNLSSMTREQAEDLIAGAGGELCAKFDRDHRGKILTTDRLNPSPFFRVRLPKFTSAAVVTLLGIGITVQAKAPSPSCEVVSVSSAQSLKERIENTQTKDGKSELVGTAFDVQGALIVGVQVTLINEKSHKEYTVATTEEGEYRLEKIEPGTYTIKIESSNFVSLKQTGIELRANERSRMDVTLQVKALGGIAILPASEKPRSIFKVLSSPIRAIKRSLG